MKDPNIDNKKRIKPIILFSLNTFGIVFLIVFSVLSLFVFKQYIPDSIIGAAFSVLGFLLPLEKISYENLTDALPWQSYLRYLSRKKEINRKTLIRISYAGYVIFKINGKYLLLKNTHGIELYQLSARTYRLEYEKYVAIKKQFDAEDDDYITDKNYYDYRLLVPANRIKRFYKFFLNDINPKTYDYSEVVDNVITRIGASKTLFKEVKTSFVSRKIFPIAFSRYTSHFEMIVADINIFEPNEEQFKELVRLSETNNDEYRFVTINELKSNGTDVKIGKRKADIAPISYEIIEHAFGKEE